MRRPAAVILLGALWILAGVAMATGDPLHHGRSMLAKPTEAKPAKPPNSNATSVVFATKAFQAAGIKIDNSTIFAPSDQAFSALAKKLNVSSVNDFLKPPLLDKSLAVLKLHVVPGKVLRIPSDIPSGTTPLPTAAGPSILVTNKLGKIEVKGPGNKKAADVVVTNVPLGTNIVHVISKVLLSSA